MEKLQGALETHQTLVSELVGILPHFVELGNKTIRLSSVGEGKEIAIGSDEMPPIERLRMFIDSCGRLPESRFRAIENLAVLEPSADYVHRIKTRIPYIELLLQRIVEHTEKAAMILIDRFGAIAEQADKGAQEAASAIESLGGKNSDGGLESLIKRSHESITNRSAVIQQFLTLNHENASRIKNISSLITKTEELIYGIEDIAERSKLITFNLAIESAKIGAKGLGFKVIVGELQKLNNQTSAFAKNILEIVKDFNTFNRELLDHWIVQSESLTEKVRADTEQAELTVEALSSSYELTRNLFSSLSKNSIQVNDSMGSVLESLQFQDITRQQIEGVEAFLSDIMESVQKCSQEFAQVGYLKKNSRDELLAIRRTYAPRLKVTSDHTIFDSIERSFE